MVPFDFAKRFNVTFTNSLNCLLSEYNIIRTWRLRGVAKGGLDWIFAIVLRNSCNLGLRKPILKKKLSTKGNYKIRKGISKL